ncbi:CDP-diacylglycerol--serine O-phosphatidyltransferase [Candidatus Blochmanniella vafra str. BVAF]|uniref:CDP-diacylglycerol--serine O-phosphatidyltransferase n=1 Tax=Blochmanniella vafra (strain BVAF) TaxID=859654 RepID=E8Q6G5_BLOVB|nr:CDP-diacylglycerol--serine O-phosphatidyltransferase [Candidatus Blochmannia vafer]ADV33934.1 CDP-diacylglycerol--serine O-phosphatidyltransferase [Candidatus Blochmannia vafer str. BVAF]
MFHKIKKSKNQLNYNIHNKFLIELPKITQKSKDFKVIYSPKEFYSALLNAIYQAYQHIYLVALYLENDQGGQNIINAILNVKKIRPSIQIKIVVDWYRAKRGRFGESTYYTNIYWYNDIINKYPHTDIAIFGIPINISEILGVLHLKGFIIDDTILYSGANLNNEYLHIYDKYRHDRYHIIKNKILSYTMLEYIEKTLLNSKVTKKFNQHELLPKLNKNKILIFRNKLRKFTYNYTNNANFNELSISPLVGLGKNSILNQTIYHLISSVKHKIIFCTPYFNIPNTFIRIIHSLLHQNKIIEIIVGDKIANDFYNANQEHEPFKFINALPYLYEINLRLFVKKLQNFIDNKQLIIRLWKAGNNGYHIKGIWVDDEWQLITGSNLNPRALRFDLENALLIHDPLNELIHQKKQELNQIQSYTYLIPHYTSLQNISDYPAKIKRLILRIRQIKFDKLINKLL